MSHQGVSKIRITPLYGGCSDTGVCVLLEVGGARILLDCGASVPVDHAYLRKTAKQLCDAGGVDAILLSHADMHHVGALPIIAGRDGLQNVPVVGTCPVGRFARLLLYDFVMNAKMEGETASAANYDFDDIDHAFRNFVDLRFSQTITLPRARVDSTNTAHKQAITVCAIAAGRTIGGAMWRIKCGATEVLYAVDVNMRREIVVSPAAVDLLPTNPTLLITDAAAASRGALPTQRKKKEKDDSQLMLGTILQTLRNGGNVLLPCETAGRALELLQLLSKFWIDEKLGMYHLIFLSHMAYNVIDYAESQLEWMSDSLTKDFYCGRNNPFSLSKVKLVTDVNAIERNYYGPKVVLATDPSLTCGLAKELLLRWGGDPRCKVIFTDQLDSQSIAAQLLSLSENPPIITNISQPVKVELKGKELLEYQQGKERFRRMKEEELLRKRREEELSQFQMAKHNVAEDEEVEEEATHEQLRKRFKSNIRTSLLAQNFVMFERTEPTFTVDEYGMSINDLIFKDIHPSEPSRWRKDKDASSSKPTTTNGNESSILPAKMETASAPAAQEKEKEKSISESGVELHPWKIVSTPQRVQFTCEFQHFNVGGRIDQKSMKTFLKRIAPSRLFLVRGSESDCSSMMTFARNSNIEEVYAPYNRQSAAFQVMMQKLQLQIPRTHVPTNVKTIKTTTSGGDAGQTTCTVCLLEGTVTTSDLAGASVVRYTGKEVSLEKSESAVTDQEDTDGEDKSEILRIKDETVGVISMGEVTLSTLEQQLNAAGVKTEIRLVSSGSVLLCAGQVLIRKENNNFSIEGPPVPAFFEARKVLYQQFAFI